MVGGVTSYGFPQHPISWDPYVQREEDVDLYGPSTVQPKPKLPPPFSYDKSIDHTNRDLNPIDTSLNPVLKKPENLEIEAIKEFRHKVELVSAKYESLTMEAQRIQRELANDTSTILLAELKTLQTIQHSLRDELNAAWEKLNDRMKSSKILSWINDSASFGFLAASVIGVGLAICTAGISLALTGAAVAMMGIAKGGVSIADGVFKDKVNSDQALLGEVQFHRELNKEIISEIVRSSKELGQFLLSMNKLTKDFLNNYSTAISANFSK